MGNTVPLAKNTARKLTLAKFCLQWLHPRGYPKEPNKTVKVPYVQVVAALTPDGSAVLEMNTAQPVKNTARKSTSPTKWLLWLHPRGCPKIPNKTVKVPYVQEAAAPTPDGSAVPEMNTVPPVKNTVKKPTLL